MTDDSTERGLERLFGEWVTSVYGDGLPPRSVTARVRARESSGSSHRWRFVRLSPSPLVVMLSAALAVSMLLVGVRLHRQPTIATPPPDASLIATPPGTSPSAVASPGATASTTASTTPSVDAVSPGVTPLTSVPPPPPPMASGPHPSCDGAVFGVGDNSTKELGSGSSTPQLVGVQIPGLCNVTAVSAGSVHTLALSADGTVWSWGSDLAGELGDGRYSVGNATPQQVQHLSGVVAIAAGNGSSVALRRDGTVWTWGANWSGELGNGNAAAQSNVPVEVMAGACGSCGTALSGIVGVSTRWEHVLAVASDGSVYSWGSNHIDSSSTAMYQLGTGNGPSGDASTPIRVVGPSGSGVLTGITAVSAGKYNSAARASDGSVYTWGNNGSGIAGQGSTGSPVRAPSKVPGIGPATEIAMGYDSAYALEGDGSVWSWGGNGEGAMTYGQLGHASCGYVIATCPTPARIGGVPLAAEVVAGADHAMVVGRDGSAWSFGHNSAGELGLGSCCANTATPQQAGQMAYQRGLAGGGGFTIFVLPQTAKLP